MRPLYRYTGGSFLLLALAGCSGSWFAEREPWRREAEEACLKSGTVKEGPAIALLSPIQGPGICGADFPLKVAALGDGSPLGYADEVRPPGLVPQGPTYQAARPTPSYQPSPSYQPAPSYQSSPGYQSSAASSSARAVPSYAPPNEPSDLRRPQAATMPLDDPYRYRGPQSAPPSSTPGAPMPLGPARAPVAAPTVAAVSPAATLACPIVSALDRWVTDAVQPAAQRWFGSPVVEIKQISAYSCRGMNGQPGAHISEHAFGNALDIAAFTLANGRTITVRDGWRGMPEEQGFLRDVEAAACEQFTTVLAPGSNSFHYDHIHVDLMRRSSGTRICNPEAVSGEEVAARAQSRLAQSPPAQRAMLAQPQRMSSAASRRREPAGDEYYESEEFSRQGARY
jgi:hypothetical protein